MAVQSCGAEPLLMPECDQLNEDWVADVPSTLGPATSVTAIGHHALAAVKVTVTLRVSPLTSDLGDEKDAAP